MAKRGRKPKEEPVTEEVVEPQEPQPEPPKTDESKPDLPESSPVPKKGKKADYTKEAKERAKFLKNRLNSSTTYPLEITRAWRVELKVISDGRWYPGWKMPSRSTLYDRLMNE